MSDTLDFETLSADLIESLTSAATGKASDSAVGWILSELNINIAPTSELEREISDVSKKLDKLQEGINSIQDSLNKLNKKMEQSIFNELVLTLPLDKIDYAHKELLNIATPQYYTDSERPGKISDLVDYIRANLLDVLEVFHNRFQGVGFTTKLISAYSALIYDEQQSLPFLTSNYFQSIWSTYVYFKLYQLAGLNLLIEYEHSQSNSNAAQRHIETYEKYDADDQKTAPKQLIPSLVVDTRSGLIWGNFPGGLPDMSWEATGTFIRFINGEDSKLDGLSKDAKKKAQDARAWNQSAEIKWRIPSQWDLSGLTEERQRSYVWLKELAFDKATIDGYIWEEYPNCYNLLPTGDVSWSAKGGSCKVFLVADGGNDYFIRN